MTVQNNKKKQKGFTEWYQSQPRAVRAGLIPILIAAIVTIAKLIPSEAFILYLVLSVTAVALGAFQVYIALREEDISEKLKQKNKSLSDKVKIYQNFIEQIDRVVSDKSQRLVNSIQESSASKRNAAIIAREKLDSLKTINRLNQALFHILTSIIRGTPENSEANIVLMMLRCDEEGKSFYMYGSVHSTAHVGSQVARAKQIKPNDPSTLAARLWDTNSPTIIAYSNTLDRSKKNEFKFLNPQEQRHVRSICGYRHDDSNDTPSFMWFVDVNKYGVFPDSDTDDDASNETINLYHQLFTSFAKRVVYEENFVTLTNAFDELIK